MFALLASTVSGHGNMVIPPTWFSSDGIYPYDVCANSACLWFTNYTFLPSANSESYAPKSSRTMPADSPMRTYARSDPNYEAFGRNPWAAPGLAKIYSPCGTYGGNPFGCPAGDEASRGKACWGGGFAYGNDARKEYGKTLTGIQTTKVTVGGEMEAAWGVRANHGGGYSYRLCKAPEDGDMTKLSEECFQKGHLDFASKYSWFQFGPDPKDRMQFEATRSDNGTYPKGSTWTRNPVPACNALDGGVFSDRGDDCEQALDKTGYRTQFDAMVPGIQGFGEHAIQGDNPANGFASTFGFFIVDKLKIPSDLTPGQYVMSFRWDCEQTSQIWNTCADIEITVSE